MYEESMRMPLVIRYPKLIPPNTKVNDIITNVDIAPTMLELAGVAIPEEIQGKSFVKLLSDQKSNDWRQSMYYHYYEYPFWHHVQPHYGIRTDRYKLIHFYYDIDVWEFYDLQEDPQELNNLIASETHQKLIEELKKELYQLKEKEYENTLSLEELRNISDTDFGGLESSKKKRTNHEK
ncbi:MAG: sulfatase/phosphatase domain-containing protein [Deinococcota bacterium]